MIPASPFVPELQRFVRLVTHAAEVTPEPESESLPENDVLVSTIEQVTLRAVAPSQLVVQRSTWNLSRSPGAGADRFALHTLEL